jgi:hypothetical protein
MEDLQHNEECRVIEDRADRPDEEDEAFYLRDVPRPRPRYLLIVHCVVGNRHLGEVVQQVIGQHLDWRHRQKRQEGARSQYAEHISEVRARPHADVFQDVREYLAAFDHTSFQYRQILLQQDQICRFLGDVRGRVNRDADVGGLQEGGRGVPRTTPEPALR